MVRVTADSATREDLGIVTEDIPDDQARKVVEKIRDNPLYKASHSNDRLVIQRFIRD